MRPVADPVTPSGMTVSLLLGRRAVAIFSNTSASAMGTANQAVHVAFRTLQGHEFRGEVVTMN